MSTELPKVDILMVGIGAAGGVASHVLTEAGMSVVAIEAGPRLDNADFLQGLDELAGNNRRNKFGDAKVNQEIPTVRLNPDETAVPGAGTLMMNAVGGTSIHYSGQTWRLMPDEFTVRSSTIERYGEEAIPEGSTIEDWPITYEELEPYYDKVEYLIGVSGSAGANPFEGPRSRELPLPPLRMTDFQQNVADVMAARGYNPFPAPASMLSEPYDDRPACSYCGFCSGFGCWNDSKSSTLVSAIPKAEATGLLEIRTESRVTAIHTNENGDVTGVTYFDKDGNEFVQPAGVVILSAFVYENIRLMFLSKSESHPDGIGNNAGQLGKNFMVHPYAITSGLLPEGDLKRQSGLGGQMMAIDDFNGDNFDHTDVGFIRGGYIAAGMESHPIATSQSIPPGKPTWGAEYREFLEEESQSIMQLFGLYDILPYEANYADLDPEYVDQYGQPRLRITLDYFDNENRMLEFMSERQQEILEDMGATEIWGAVSGALQLNSHTYGGTRMGTDPQTSVTDSYGFVHDAPNLLVLGGGTFVTSSGYNPTLTIQATTWRAAEYLVENFQDIAL